MSDLYHPLILKHSREPLHFHERKDAEIILDAYNPICGDDYKIYLDLVDDHLKRSVLMDTDVLFPRHRPHYWHKN